MILVYTNMMPLFLKIRLCSYKITINYLLSLFFYAIQAQLSFFHNIIIYTLNIVSTIKKITVNEFILEWDFILENYYKRTGFVK